MEAIHHSDLWNERRIQTIQLEEANSWQTKAQAIPQIVALPLRPKKSYDPSRQMSQRSSYHPAPKCIAFLRWGTRGPYVLCLPSEEAPRPQAVHYISKDLWWETQRGCVFSRRQTILSHHPRSIKAVERKYPIHLIEPIPPQRWSIQKNPWWSIVPQGNAILPPPPKSSHEIYSCKLMPISNSFFIIPNKKKKKRKGCLEEIHCSNSVPLYFKYFTNYGLKVLTMI